MQHLRARLWLVAILAVGIMLISSTDLLANQEVLKVRMTLPSTTVLSNATIVPRVDFLNNNWSTPLTLVKWYVVVGYSNLTVSGPFEIGNGYVGVLNPQEHKYFNFNLTLVNPQPAASIASVCVYAEAIRTEDFGNNTTRNVTTIVGGQLLMVKVK